MVFKTEVAFESALISALQNKGWESRVLKYPTEEELLQNWANILFENNRSIDRLNDTPLTKTEMDQILEKVIELRTPVKLNGFINGRTVSVIRDNPADQIHYGKEVSLKIYDRQEIAAGQSRYQIVQQPQFKSKSRALQNRRGDLMLLINGMPVFHIELKKSGIPVSQAYYQIEKYAREGVFSGIFSLIQIFVAMQPDETVYFANPGPDGKFNKDFYFHWADFNNDEINNWRDIASFLLSIPMAHQLIGFYTVADDSDGILKVMRSYQYYAANAISDRVSKKDWRMLGGYVWHTTGSGKTMTSFKAAQLIANSKDADKVIFLMDRITLGTQSLREYRAFADDAEDVQGTENTLTLITKLKSTDPANTLIVTSIQKMSNIKNEEDGLNATDMAEMNSKRIVFIIDEAHRSTFGDMLITIKQTFPDAIFFGFTGTPIEEENKKKLNTTATVFGNELHRYSIADGIRDGNVLSFDPYKILTYKDSDLRKEVALMKALASTEREALEDPQKAKVYYTYMDSSKVPMAGYIDNSGKYIKGIEDYVPPSQYRREEHKLKVVEDILNNWNRLSHNSKFHALFATSSIPEAIEYYQLFKKQNSSLKITALFDPNIDNISGFELKTDGLVEILEDYNERYDQDFNISTHAKFKKDISDRLAHKKPYERIEFFPNMQIDLLIVVEQMLTGFDSKWLNTLYLDKTLEYEHVIQAFSRTNRLFGPDKPFGTIRYYRYPNSMERNIETAVATYSGNRPFGVFVEQLDYNLEKMNQVFEDISKLFVEANVPDFTSLPNSLESRGRFAKLFSEFNEYLEAAKVQGFSWKQLVYTFDNPEKIIEMLFDEETYLILALRYKELTTITGGSGGEDLPFEIDGYLIEIDTERIDVNYMNSRFEKYLKQLYQEEVSKEQLSETLNELHKSFATLTQEEQKYANIFLHDVQSGSVKIKEEKTFREYITEYQFQGKNKQLQKVSSMIGVDILKMETLMNSDVTETNLNVFGRFDDLKKTADREKAKLFFENLLGTTVPTFRLNVHIETLLRDFILSGGFDIEDYKIS